MTRHAIRAILADYLPCPETVAASDQTWGQSRGWFIEDGQIVGWAMIHGLSAGDSEYVEVTR